MQCKCTAKGKKPDFRTVINASAFGRMANDIIGRNSQGGQSIRKRCRRCGVEVSVSQTIKDRQ